MVEEMEVIPPSPRGTKRKGDGSLQLPAPRRIKALAQDVVNKIAAGEIIVAPVHALKELIENAVDAGSTALEIVVKDGGLKFLQITDNGHGIDVRFSLHSSMCQANLPIEGRSTNTV
jgi:DNA mismatch repair protein MLH1